MRIWSVHPQYLDTKGLVALWRETLLAKHVLEGITKGYKNHPQLERFKKCKDPLNAINFYLAAVYHEAEKRGYHFDRSKLDWKFQKIKMRVTKGQLDYEVEHLLRKLKKRDPMRFNELRKQKRIHSHSLFRVVPGPVAHWEII